MIINPKPRKFSDILREIIVSGLDLVYECQELSKTQPGVDFGNKVTDYEFALRDLIKNMYMAETITIIKDMRDRALKLEHANINSAEAFSIRADCDDLLKML